MIGNEYQLFLSQPPLYVIRKVQRKTPKEGIFLLIINLYIYRSESFQKLF